MNRDLHKKDSNKEEKDLQDQLNKSAMDYVDMIGVDTEDMSGDDAIEYLCNYFDKQEMLDWLTEANGFTKEEIIELDMEWVYE